MSVALDVRLSKPNKTYRQGDLVGGTISVNSNSEFKHDGIGLSLEGTIAMQLDNKNILLETFSSSVKPVQIALASFEMVKPGRFSAGTTEIPFDVKLMPLTNKSLYETYHGVYLTIQYLIKVEMKRSVLNRDLMKTIEFVVEVPEPYDECCAKPKAFNITPESLHNVAETVKLPKFCIKGQLDSCCFVITKPMLGELIVERCAIPVKSIELQLCRIETCGGGSGSGGGSGGGEGFTKETTEIQNIQIGDGDVSRNIPLPIHMVFPRLFTCPTIVTSTFKIEFELNLIVIFEDDHLVMETFDIKLVRPK